jgi:hypothetical protein
MDLLDIPAYFDPIDRIEGLVSTFINADWAGTYRRRGGEGVLMEFVACLTSRNAPTIRISRYSSWHGIDVERLLKRHGVKVWDRGLAGDDLYFCVKRRQVKWAEYLLMRAGVPVTSVLVDPRNRDYGQRYPPGSEPPKRKPPTQPDSDFFAFIRSLFR